MGLWEQRDKFADVRAVRVQASRVMRCRPIFRDWSLEFTAMHDPSVMAGRAIAEALEIAGQQIGLGDFRPKFGRFTVESL